MANQDDNPEVIIPEVLPPEPERGNEPPRRSKKERAARIFGPIVAGAIIDGIDFVTMGFLGILLGFVVMFWIASVYRLPLWQRVLWGLAAAVYCGEPFKPMRWMPLGTLIGAYVQFREAS